MSKVSLMLPPQDAISNIHLNAVWGNDVIENKIKVSACLFYFSGLNDFQGASLLQISPSSHRIYREQVLQILEDILPPIHFPTVYESLTRLSHGFYMLTGGAMKYQVAAVDGCVLKFESMLRVPNPSTYHNYRKNYYAMILMAAADS